VTRVEWHWVERFALQFELCGLRSDESVVVLAETASRPELVETAWLAAQSSGAACARVTLPTPPNPGPVAIRSTGASVAIQGHAPTVAALRAADFVVDCTVEGLLHAPELGAVLESGTRVLMISNEHPETFERMVPDPGLAARVALGTRRLSEASTMRVTSAHGTDLTVDLTGAFRAGSHGATDRPGDIAHWPGGLVLAFPAAGTVHGTVVLAPGDVNLTFKEYVRSEVRLTIVADHITAIDGPATGGRVDADLFASYLAAFGEPEAYATSHVGWGMNTHARWDALPLGDKSQTNGTEIRAFAGNFLYSTGANEVAGRFCRGHFDLPMRHCTVTLDGRPVVTDGRLAPDLAPAADADTGPAPTGPDPADHRSPVEGDVSS
jgi:2,5-dihydroxypyridine 5,6-dioxygenase